MLDMLLLIPPYFEPSMPLLGPAQIKSYATLKGIKVNVIDYNLKFVTYIFDSILSNKGVRLRGEHGLNDCEHKLEFEALNKYITSFQNINTYQDILYYLRNTNSLDEYWNAISLINCVYDYFSIEHSNIVLKYNNISMPYNWYNWDDSEAYLSDPGSKWMEKLYKGWLCNSLRDSDVMSIGINITFSSQYFFALQLMDIVKRIRPDIRIIVGGGFITTFVNSSEKCGPLSNRANVIYSGDGEPLIEQLRSILHGNPHKIGQSVNSNCLYITANELTAKKFRMCPPDFSDNQLEQYLAPSKIVPLKLSSKCYWNKCSFCTERIYGSSLNDTNDVSQFIKLITTEQSNSNLDCVYFLDSAIQKKVIIKVVQTILDQNINIKWGTNARLDDSMDDEKFIKKMRESGCVHIRFGLESASQLVVDKMNKGIVVSKAGKIINTCRKYGISVHCYIIFGFPGETKSDRDITREFLLSDYSRPDNYSCSKFVLYDSAPIARDLANCFLKIEDHNKQWGREGMVTMDNGVDEEIRKLRDDFDGKWHPYNVLMSNSHTIAFEDLEKEKQHAYPNALAQDSKIRLNRDMIILKGDDEQIKGKGEYVICKWSRIYGFLYLKNNMAKSITDIFRDEVTLENALTRGIGIGDIFRLINERVLVVTEKGVGTILKNNEPSTLNIEYAGVLHSRLKNRCYYES